MKINLIQSSAVNLSLSVDDSRHLPEVVEELRSCQFRVVYNNDMQLLTIRGYTTAMLEKYASGSDIYLTQRPQVFQLEFEGARKGEATELREKLYGGYLSQGMRGNANDNRAVTAEIEKL